MKTRNNQTEKLKIVFCFSFLVAVAFFGGICLFRILGQDTKELLKNSILLHFDAILPNTDKALFLWHRTWRMNISEFVCVFLVLLFSFSFISRLVSDIVLMFVGFRFGLCASAVYNLGFSRAGFGNSLCFWLLKGLMLWFIYNYACKITVLSMNSRHYSAENGRIMMKRSALLSMLGLTVFTACALILLGGAYCLFIYAF